MAAHWLVSFVPLLLLSPLLAMFLNLTVDMYIALVLTLILGTPLLSLIGAIAVGLTVGLQKGGVLLALLLIPVFIPLLIFATSAVDSAALHYLSCLAIIAAMLLLAAALAPLPSLLSESKLMWKWLHPYAKTERAYRLCLTALVLGWRSSVFKRRHRVGAGLCASRLSAGRFI